MSSYKLSAHNRRKDRNFTWFKRWRNYMAGDNQHGENGSEETCCGWLWSSLLETGAQGTCPAVGKQPRDCQETSVLANNALGLTCHWLATKPWAKPPPSWARASSSIQQVYFYVTSTYAEFLMCQALRCFVRLSSDFQRSWVLETLKAHQERNTWSSFCHSHWAPLSPLGPASSPSTALPPCRSVREETHTQRRPLFSPEKRRKRHDLVMLFLQPVEIYFWDWWAKWL